MAKRRYPWLRFAEGVNWQNVNPTLLVGLNQLGARIKQPITVTSGHRSTSYQARLYAQYKAGKRAGPVAPPGSSLHETGMAVDATINGKAVGDSVSPRLLARYGLATPVAGDPVHVQLLNADVAADVPPPAAPQAPTLAVSASPDLGVLPTTPPVTVPPMPELPGSASTNVRFDPASTWRLLAAQPLASPETQRYARMYEEPDAA